MPFSKKSSDSPTSSEVARHAGVSRTTVSFVLNDVRGHGISEKTRQKVLSVAHQLGYEPHAAARSLAGGTSKTIALVIPCSEHLHVDAFLPRLLSAVNERCHFHGYKVLLASAEDQSPGAFINLVKSKRVDGLIIINMRVAEEIYIQNLAKHGFPVAVPGHGSDSFYSRYRHEGNTNVAIAKRVTRHLINLGHQRIAHLSFAPPEFTSTFWRHAGYQQALEEASLPIEARLFAYANISAQSGYAAMQQLLAQKIPFSALFAGNDTVALGAMRALLEAGLRIPHDVALVGWDDIPLAAFVSPSLTTVRTDPVTRGIECVEMLVAKINGSLYIRSEAEYENNLIIRESCGAALNVSAKHET